MTLKKSHADSGSSRRISSSSSTDASNPKKASSGGLAAGSTTPSTVPLTLSATSTESAKLRELNVVVAELKLTLENMERERDFYFAKLRELEVLIQTQAETMEKPDMIRQIQEILYSNEASRMVIVCPIVPDIYLDADCVNNHHKHVALINVVV